MKTITRILIVTCLAISLLCSTGCVSIGNTYSNAAKYTAGNTSFTGSQVAVLDISWVSGSIHITRHDADTITVTEHADSALREEELLHTWLEDDTLHIQYAKSGITFSDWTLQKQLEIELPEDLNLEGLYLDGSSTDSVLEQVSATDITISVSSGTIQLLQCATSNLELDSSSGDLLAELTGTVESIEADTSSGNIEIAANTVGTLETDASSGNIHLTVQQATTVSADTASGNVTLQYPEQIPAKTKVDTASGDITLHVPKQANFTIKTDTDLDSDLAFQKTGDTYRCGTGENKINLDTASGKIRITSEK